MFSVVINFYFLLLNLLIVFLFFFFKQKTAYEMLRSLVGSEMCIRDRYSPRASKNLSRNKLRSMPLRWRKGRCSGRSCEGSQKYRKRIPRSNRKI